MFRSSDYTLSYNTFFPFNLHISTDTPITFIKKTSEALVFTSTNYVLLHTNIKERKVRFDSDISSLDTTAQLILAASNNGIIKLFNYKKVQLSTYDEFSDRVNDIKFINYHKFIASSNDKTARIFDINDKQSIRCFNDHKDFVSCVCVVDDNHIFTGSYDRKVIGYDLRSAEKMKEYRLDGRINKICGLDDNSIIVSEKYKMHKIDLRYYKKSEFVYAHTKEVSMLQVYKNMIYSASHDGTLKTFDFDLKNNSQIKFNDKILACDIMEDDIYVGLENGNIFNLVKENKEDKKKDEKIVTLPMRYYNDTKDTAIKKVKYSFVKKNEYERHINNNQHWIAFSKVLGEKDADLVYGVLKHIYERRGFRKVLMDRSEADIRILIDFIIDNFYVYDFRMINHSILGVIMESYVDYFINDSDLHEKILFLSELVDEEVKFQEEAIYLHSFLDAFLLNQN